MPTKRTRRTHGRQVLTLEALSPWEELDLAIGWSPPRNAFERERSRWQNWQDLLHDYVGVREEFLVAGFGAYMASKPFAEWLYQRYGMDAHHRWSRSPQNILPRCQWTRCSRSPGCVRRTNRRASVSSRRWLPIAVGAMRPKTIT
jgi:hypothetical protein